VGDRANVARATRLAQQMASRRCRCFRCRPGQQGELKELNLKSSKAECPGSVLKAILGSPRSNLPQGRKFRCGCCSRHPAEITETDVDLAAASGAVDRGFQHLHGSGAKKAAECQRRRRARLRGDPNKLLEDNSARRMRVTRAEMWRKPWVKPRCGPFSVRPRTAVAGCLHQPAAKLQRTARSGCNRAKQVGLRRGDARLPCVGNKDDVKRGGTGFEVRIGCVVSRQLARTRIASRPTSWSPKRRSPEPPTERR